LRDLAGRAKPSHAVLASLARASRLTADLRVLPPVTLSRRQLVINQRISQAAVRRLNLIRLRLDEGLSGNDLRPGGIGPPALGPGIGVVTGARSTDSLRDDATVTGALHPGPRCRRFPRRLLSERVRRALRAVRRSGGCRCESRPDWLDDDGLAAALVLDGP
jgi:hypothetical protein